jgi:heptosyltransferase-2
MSLLRPSSSFPKLNLRKWLLVKFKIDLMPDIHIVDRYFKAVTCLGVKNDGQGLEYYIPGEDIVDPLSLPASHRDDFIAFAIGGKHATKCLPAEKIAEICHKAARPVILRGGREDHENGEMIKKSVGENIFNACGLFSINQSADIVRKARAVITHDTGLMHIAAAFGKKTISVWGNTVPALGMYPYMPGMEERSTIVEVKGLSCRPCSKLGYDKCPKGHFKCMNAIDIQTIINNLDKE